MADDAPDREMTVLSDTAFTSPEGQFRWTSTDLLGHRVDYAITDNVEIGATVLLPIGLVGGMPEVTFGGQLGRKVHGALVLRGVAAAPLADLDDGAFAVGGEARLTVGTPQQYLNLTVHAYGGSTNLSKGDLNWIVIPTLGGGISVSDMVQLHLAFGAVIPATGNVEPVWGTRYGVRLRGAHLFGDIGFVLPLDKEWFDGPAEYMPLGIPMLNFGYAG